MSDTVSVVTNSGNEDDSLLYEDLLHCSDKACAMVVFQNQLCSDYGLKYKFEDGVLVLNADNGNQEVYVKRIENQMGSQLAKLKIDNHYGSVLAVEWRTFGSNLTAQGLDDSNVGRCEQLLNMTTEQAKVGFISRLETDGLIAFAISISGPLMNGITYESGIHVPAFFSSVTMDMYWVSMDLENEWARFTNDSINDPNMSFIDLEINKSIYKDFSPDSLPPEKAVFLKNIMDRKSITHIKYLKIMSKYLNNNEEVVKLYKEELGKRLQDSN